MKLSFLGSNLTLHSQQYLTHHIAKAAAKRLHSSLGLPCPYQGKYLRQLAKGLMIGKISYAAAAVDHSKT
ncbi:Hypothetical protein FKW44_008712 [Caligus rogercresseyi]|uniref:Uncharacterized protein n=1 Tax=Caligus rogercresseyi TaxID=217165 RepID=A0A7T8QUG9_CALRO|nr:Hypothetical protein FKW44_008712 [Caligus rogercresseyi]